MIVELLLLISIVLLFVYYQLTKDYNYWKKRGVKYAEPSFIFGNFFDLIFFRKDQPTFHRDIYEAGAGERYIGIIETRTPAIYIRDPELIRCILGKDFSYFRDRGIPADEKRDKLSTHLFKLDGARWKNLRAKLTPTFTSGKMKNMFPFVEECAREMVDILDGHAEQEDVIEMREILARFTTDVIGTCAFGVHCNSLKNPNAEFRKMGALVFKNTTYSVLFELCANGFPSLANILPRPDGFKKIDNFFYDTTMRTVKFREENNVVRHDFIDLLIQLKKKGTIVSNPEDLKNDAFLKSMGDMKIDDFEFTDSMMAAQGFVFFVAGFETSSSALSYALIEIARNPEIQQKLQDEIDMMFQRHGNKITYDALMEMPYLDKVVSETLRMYPPISVLFRAVTEPYQIPDSDVVLEKKLRLYIPVYAIHRDPEIYPDPETFDPERFTEEEKQKRHNYAYLPFGEGPRNCIGLRFGLMQIKVGLATLLHKYQFELGAETTYPPVYAKSTFLLTQKHGTWLKIKKRTPQVV